ncbi:hypothetical protein ACFLYO_02600 [Chloroflexota bacterium]
MRLLADFVRAGITGVMWMVIGVMSIAILVASLESSSLLGMFIGAVAIGVMVLVAMALTVGIWRVALSWQGSGTPAQADLDDPLVEATKEKRDTAYLMERLVDNLDNDEMVELETLLMSRSDLRETE